MSWDQQIASITDAGFQAGIYALEDGKPYTTDHLKMTLAQVQVAAKAIEEGAAGVVEVDVGEKS